ncbi:MAG: formyl-CoA transferase [Candidatus Azotimanducaceae bacterium]|jgi:formyl-CoA transferase
MDSLFSGLKVIDAASFVAGPCAATIMSDYGADVIKIEPLSGDRQRTIAGGHESDFSWQLTGRNKRSLSMDITNPEGYGVLMKMLSQADVFLVNFSAANLERYKLTFDILKANNPRLIFAQITAYGLKGPDAERRAFDLTGWFARTGIMDIMHDKDVAPSPPAGGVGDHATGMTLFAGIVMALYKRDKTGEGSMVSTSLAATGTWANGLNLQGTLAGLDGATRRNKEGWSNPVSNVYTTADDRHIVLGLQNAPRDWPKLVGLLGHPEWLEDERMANGKVLMKNRFLVKDKIAEGFAALHSSVLCERLSESGIVFSLVAYTTEVIDDPQLIANGVIVETQNEVPGNSRTFATPINMSDEMQKVPQRGPKVGEHSVEILAEFGFSSTEIDALAEESVIRLPRKK